MAVESSPESHLKPRLQYRNNVNIARNGGQDDGVYSPISSLTPSGGPGGRGKGEAIAVDYTCVIVPTVGKATKV